MTTSLEIKKMARQSGADLCGIAPVERFNNAPEGFHPCNIYPNAKSVIVIAKREPESIFHSKSLVPYTFTTKMTLHEIFRISMELVIIMEQKGYIAIPIPSVPYEYWDDETMTGKGILSLKHAGQLAGLGVIGRNTLLVNKKFGNMLRLGAIITNLELEGDTIESFTFCNDKCNLCIQNCPAKAIDGKTVIQIKCREKSDMVMKKEFSICTCNICRNICPYKNGFDGYTGSISQELKKIIRIKFN